MNKFDFWLIKITKVPLEKNQWNILTSGIRQWASVRAWEDMTGEGKKREVDEINHCDRYYYKYLSLLVPPKQVMICLHHHHHSKNSVYTGMAKWKGSKEYIKEMVNKVCPFWVHYSLNCNDCCKDECPQCGFSAHVPTAGCSEENPIVLIDD
jgi:hypothetical protein